jgi:hypothetical protein
MTAEALGDNVVSSHKDCAWVKADTDELSSIGKRRSDFGGGSVKFF